MIASTPNPPYYAVIFTSVRTPDDNGYAMMADELLQLAALQDGFLGVESARIDVGITVSYWRDLQSIEGWKNNARHQFAKKEGKRIWYQSFKLRIAKVESDRDFQF